MSKNNNLSFLPIICLLGFVSIAHCNVWCVPERNAEQEALAEYLNFACAELREGCEPIQPGKECFDPPTLLAHCGYVMDAYFKISGVCPKFGHLVHTDPSYGACIYPSRPS